MSRSAYWIAEKDQNGREKSDTLIFSWSCDSSERLKMKRVIIDIYITCLTLDIIVCDNCCQINSRELPYYKLTRSNARSSQSILSRTTVQNVNECRKFASTKKALAFNYGLENYHRGKVIFVIQYACNIWIISVLKVLFLFAQVGILVKQRGRYAKLWSVLRFTTSLPSWRIRIINTTACILTLFQLVKKV